MIHLERLLSPKNLDDHIDVSNLLSSMLENIITSNVRSQVPHIWERETYYFAQMIYSKLKHLIKLSGGFELVDNGKQFIDPCVHFIISRNIFESVVFFNLQHVFHTVNEEKELVYRLWRLSSLKYRQRLIDPNYSVESLQLFNEEKKEIDSLIIKIRASHIYQTATNQEQLDRSIKQKKYWVIVENGVVNGSLGPQKILEKMTKSTPLLKEQYNRYSLFTHPSNETVQMFENIFKDGEHEILVGYNLRVTNCLVAMFLSDFLEVYPQNQPIFDSMDDKCKIVCRFYNCLIR